MKKLISVLLTAAMVVSLVPATAFAAGDVTATAKVVDARDLTKDEAANYGKKIADSNSSAGATDAWWNGKVPELQLEVTKASYQGTTTSTAEMDVTLTFDNAELNLPNATLNHQDNADYLESLVDVWADDAKLGADNRVTNGDFSISVDPADIEEDSFKFTIVPKDSSTTLRKDNVITVDLESVLTKTGVGTVATVSVDSDMVTADDLAYISVEAKGITATTRKVGNVAVDERTNLDKDLVIKSTVGNFVRGQVIELKLNNGFEFTNFSGNVADVTGGATLAQLATDGDNEATLTVTAETDKITIKPNAFQIEATSAKAGATAVITVKAVRDSNIVETFSARTTVEVLKVVDYTVVLSVDEDADVPVIYNSVNVDNYGITDDSDHMSLEVTAEETFAGAWSFRKGFNFELPEGVYVTDIDVTEVAGLAQDNNTNVGVNEVTDAFFNAYQDGDHLNFEFDKRVFNDVDVTLNDDKAKMVFKLELVADPGFVGDVTLKLTGDLVDEQEVTIAKFVAPYEITAEQNDLKIDYRYTEIPTSIVIKEAEAGLWDADNAAFALYVEKPTYIVFEDDPTYTVDDKSNMKLDKTELREGNWDGGNDAFDAVYFRVDAESDEAATVTISDLSLFMERSIPAGPYDLKVWTSMEDAYVQQGLFAPECNHDYATHVATDCADVSFVDDVSDYSTTVKEAFVNVVTAGREQDDASFTTKVVVPVGEKYIIAGEVQYDIDVPAYINANGYTMLPVRAVAVALGINNNNVLWDQATKTVTILYGQRIITMQVGASVIYVNGSAIPASSSVEITDSRTFLGLRDLATALGVTTINWDPATKTASLN